jgi:hypothetical protein
MQQDREDYHVIDLGSRSKEASKVNLEKARKG